ncbi:oxidoreductase [Blastococcus sp. MG754426]|uniref:oxidoreductase n=1 Tax=unclassified Blastococcus TaxID=2619396 RepID=UPI001EEFC8E5|nr:MULTISPECIES: oxidoreductase [unclassified Blastococcus]MCF6506939.1 oxidoreductase [Blastococcus sp. MG754426]MCF6511815.1 oxidoreductase [Blastococcus sp. MG754427]MCF6735969.1 oxidoreductase [Blastococcus sp. KM273129]
MTTTAEKSGSYRLGDREVHRIGYGAMQLTGPHVMGPPADREAAIAVLRRAVELGVDHIDTSDYYGPTVVNELIREALHPYPDDLVIVTKVGARRDADGGWPEALAPDDLRRAVEENIDHLGVEALDVVNLRMPGFAEPVERSLAEPFEALAAMQQEGLVRHLGVSNVTPQMFAEAQSIAPVVCVQNHYNLVHRHDDPMIDALAREGIAYTPFFPLGGFTPLQSAALETVARRLGTTPKQVALTWLLARSPNLLLIPGTSSVAHLEENLQAAARVLGPEELAELDRIGGTGEPDPAG